MKPPSGTEIAALPALTINAQPGGQLTISGTAPGLQIDYGADRIADGISNLLNNLDSTSVTNNETIIFPAGDNILSLSSDTFIGIDSQHGISNSSSYVKIKRFTVYFTVHNGTTAPTWTLPSSIKLDITMANGKPNINNSGVRITWAPNNSTIPPHDEKGATTAWVNADFYRGNSMITRVVKNQPITSNATTITGNTPQWFDGIGVTLDLRDNHTTSLAL